MAVAADGALRRLPDLDSAIAAAGERCGGEVSPLEQAIARRIRLQGPISVAAFMAEALGHPEHGYYMKADPLGARGDFITAPEISQMFGELIGLWCAEVWRLMGQPDPLQLIELGPGRGTLMADALRAAKVLTGFVEAVRIHFVETSPALRERQKATLAPWPVAWHQGIDSLPEGPSILVANEFFDALPAHQFERRPEGWRERMVALDGERFMLTVSPYPTPPEMLIPQPLRIGAPVGAVAEVSPSAVSTMRAIAERIDTTGGAALVVDYGHADHRAGATLQAVRRHQRHEFLAEPGAADLTAHVDFAALAGAARAHAVVHGPVAQGDFLRSLGIELRARQLRMRADDAQKRAIDVATQRLIDPDEMGTLFKVLAVCDRGLAPPPGFERAESAK
jgi:NADH dehydrogenase [ubiquinone] 1 alpha subcomplex assembly factor 7